jgi:hypothetical protein
MQLASPTPRPAAPRRLLRPALVLLVGALAALTGCITTDGTLKADGSGTLEVSYKQPPNSNESVEKKRFASADVTLDSFAIKEGMVVAKLSFADPAKLSSMPLFRDAKIARQREGKEERLTITMTNVKPQDAKDQGKPGPRISITLPGKVIEASRNATIAGNKVTWSIPLVEYFRSKTIELMARYEVAGTDQPAAEGKPADAPAQKKPEESKQPPAKK